MISYKSLESIRGHLCVKLNEGGSKDWEQLTKLISVVENEMELQEQEREDSLGVLKKNRRCDCTVE